MEARKALFSLKDGQGRTLCGLCPRSCRFAADGDTGFCGTRRLENGELYASTYGRLIATHNDPIEKKPLFHYFPGSLSFSIAAAGCNLACPFCQNHSISQAPKRSLKRGDTPGTAVPPEEVVEAAARQGSASISVTYTEPILLLEYTEDMADSAKRAGLGIVYVTNGAWSRDAAKRAGRLIDAANVDLKCFSDKKYREVLGVPMSSVLETIESLVADQVWVEVTTLLVPDFSDDEKDLEATARRLAGISRDMPWHVTRFHPDYRWTDRPPTPVSLLVRAREIGLAAGLRYVYTGNVAGDPGENTSCPSCGSLLIERMGFRSRVKGISGSKCMTCGAAVAGRGLP